MKKILSVFAVLFLAVGASAEGLEFNKTTLTFKPHLPLNEVKGVYKLTNSGKEKISIVKVSKSCPCLASSHKESTIEPGKSVELNVTCKTNSDRVKVGVKNNFFLYVIYKVGDEGEEQIERLEFNVTTPKYITFSPRALTWHGNEANSAKTMTVKAAKGYKFHNFKATIKNSTIKYTVQEVTPGKLYKIICTPLTITKFARVPINFYFEAESSIFKKKVSKTIKQYLWLDDKQGTVLPPKI